MFLLCRFQCCSSCFGISSQSPAHILSPTDLQIPFLMLKSSYFGMYQPSFAPQKRTSSFCYSVHSPAIPPSKLVMWKHDIPAEVVYFIGFASSNVHSLQVLISSLLEHLYIFFEHFSSTLSCLSSASNCLKSYSKSRTLFLCAFALVSHSSLEPNWAVGFHVDDGQCSSHCR